jgi:anti-anti-sigma factor
MNKEIAITLSKKGEVALIDIQGDVTAISGEAVEAAYHSVSDEGLRKILLCFNQEAYINSGGIAFLIGIAAESRKKAQTIRITGLSSHFQKIFNMVGLTKYAQIFPSEESALKDF